MNFDIASISFDIIVIAILVFGMVFGFRSGFIYTFIHTIGWLLIGFIWAPKLCDFITQKTDFYNSLYNAFLIRFSESFTIADDTVAQLPEILAKFIDSTEMNFVSSVSKTMTDLCFSIISFLLVVLAVKLMLWLITEMFSKKQNGGFTGLLDGILGLAFGLMRSFLVVFFLLALLVPVSSFLAPDTASALIESLSKSVFTKDLYDNNLLMLIVRDFLI